MSRLCALNEIAHRVEHLGVGCVLLGHAGEQLNLDSLEHIGEEGGEGAGESGSSISSSSAQVVNTDSSSRR